MKEKTILFSFLCSLILVSCGQTFALISESEQIKQISFLSIFEKKYSLSSR